MPSMHRVLIAGVAAGALAFPAASPAEVDLRSPDTRDAANGYAPTLNRSYLSPDAADRNRGITPADVTVPPAAAVVSVEADDGFDWGDAGIGAGVLLAVVLLGVGGVMLVGHRRGSGPTPLAH